MKKTIIKSGFFRKSNKNNEIAGELNLDGWLKKALAYLRGDSSLSSQDVYTFKETELEANKYLGQYQREIFGI